MAALSGRSDVPSDRSTHRITQGLTVRLTESSLTRAQSTMQPGSTSDYQTHSHQRLSHLPYTNAI
ncbi:hypothetical protein [Fibrisoma limi]|uniref:hypothetical protein n=1 Tax=Fibrisoma limi TaxID=663275 RepID=UPI001788CCA9|nr:hypothetical protein [Fibrisoma limi]